MKKIEYKTNDKIGNCFFIRETEPYISLKGQKKRKVLVKCGECDNEFKVEISSLIKGNTTSCGCYFNKIVKVVNKTHGDSYNNYIYKLWENIKKRCYNQNVKAFKNYGGRGIEMHKPWIKDYSLFKEYILNNLGERPYKCSLDRINNNGNYVPGNLRWTDSKTQVHNSRRYID